MGRKYFRTQSLILTLNFAFRRWLAFCLAKTCLRSLFAAGRNFYPSLLACRQKSEIICLFLSSAVQPKGRTALMQLYLYFLLQIADPKQ